MSEIVSKNPVNEPSAKSIATRSHFSLGAPRLNTYRFGEYGVFDALEIVPDDKNCQMSLRHSLRTYTLGQPLMSKAMFKKDLFFVPAQCILPLNWDKVYTNPLHGDDVDASEVGVAFNLSKLYLACDSLQNLVDGAYSDPDYDNKARLRMTLKWLVFLEYFFSNGSLLNCLGAKLSPLCSCSNSSPSRLSFDAAFDKYITGLSTIVKSIKVTGIRDDVYLVGNDYGDWRTFLCEIRDGFSWGISDITFASGHSDLPTMPLFNFAICEDNLSLARPLAYQICCAHYFSNDKIDYIYDANLYRQNVDDCIQMMIDDGYLSVNDRFFMLNGSQFFYDSLSAHFFTKVLRAFEEASDPTVIDDLGDYFRLILGFNRSLRFVDYFTGSKSQPLAVGDVNVAVSSNKVSVIDVTQKIQKQRFLNAVNRAGRRISEYTKALFPGLSQAPDYHNPFFLAHTTDTIGTQEVENTGSDQFLEPNSVSTVLRSDAGQYAFETDFDRTGVLIGICYFDIERAYSRGIERLMQHVDRYDMFNPFMQFTGDQDVKQSELDSRGVSTFGYQLRYMEYKQRYPQASGGFVENLPGYAFLANEYRDLYDGGEKHIGPDFIRSLQTELDPFYLSLTGYSLGSYFHFMVVHFNSLEIDRPMAYAPSIL